MAKRNHTLVFGSGIYGVMGAIARGIKSSGGKRIGVVPEFITKTVTVDTDCDEFIVTETMRERKQIMEDRSDAFVMMPGGIGTFEEFFEILTLKQLKQHTKPIILYNINDYYNPLIDMLETAINQKFMSPNCRKLIFVGKTPEDVFNYLDTYCPSDYDKYRY